MRYVFALALVLALAAAPAQAHKLKVFATAEGPVITGSAYFSGGDKAMGIGGVVLAPDGTLAGTVRTDRDGVFHFTVRARMNYTITMDAGDGHVASTVIPADQLPLSLPAGMAGTAEAPATPPPAAAMTAADTDAIEAAVARQIRPLRQQLDAYDDKVRLHDILGGIGTIFGVFGIAAWLSARRRSP